jgi:hypothetical protein
MDLLPSLCLLCCFCFDRTSRDEEKYDRNEKLELAVKRNLVAEPTSSGTSASEGDTGTERGGKGGQASTLMQARGVGAGMEYRRSEEGVRTGRENRG